jgi:molybdopterin molybdotransferase
VVRRPSISIILTGNELLPAFSIPEFDKICDANSPMLRELANRDGAGSILIEKVHDHHDALASVLMRQTTRDVVLVSGGSSVGLEDHAPDVLSRVGTLEVHGLALRPASPAGFGRLASGTRVFLLPGNPVSCLCAYELLAGRLIRRLGGHCDDLPHKTVRLPLGAPLISASGRTDFARIRVHDEKAFPLAISGAAMLSTVVLADGFVLIPPESETLEPGELVTVHLF